MGISNKVNEFIKKHQDYDKSFILDKLQKEFNLTKESAITYYYIWKREFMSSYECIPKEEIENISDDFKVQEAIVIKGKYGYYIKQGKRVISGEEIFNCITDIELYRKKELNLFYKRLNEIIEIMKL